MLYLKGVKTVKIIKGTIREKAKKEKQEQPV